MSDLTLSAVARFKVTKQAARGALVAGAHRVVERLRREQTGQDVLEYSGLIVLVAGLIVLLYTLHVPATVGTAMAHAFNSVFQTNHTYTPPTPIADPPATG